MLVMSVYGTDFQLLHRTKSRRDPGTADMTDGLSGLNWGAHDPTRTLALRSLSKFIETTRLPCQERS